MATTITWCCRVCDAAMESVTGPVEPICPACARARRIDELTSRRAHLWGELEAVEIELSRLGGKLS